jgi:hypothetical protein
MFSEKFSGQSVFVFVIWPESGPRGKPSGRSRWVFASMSRVQCLKVNAQGSNELSVEPETWKLEHPFAFASKLMR